MKSWRRRRGLRFISPFISRGESRPEAIRDPPSPPPSSTGLLERLTAATSAAKIVAMDADRLNFFQPFERLEPGHENQLTRALVLVLRLSPLAHATWLARLKTGKRLLELPGAQFATQRRAIPICPGYRGR